jgi:hypothetical protein
MIYAVVWRPPAEQELARLWLNAASRTAFTAAANRIDRLLGQDPVVSGCWLLGATRTLILPPLAVAYEVIEDDRQVRVFTAWREG